MKIWVIIVVSALAVVVICIVAFLLWRKYFARNNVNVQQTDTALTQVDSSETSGTSRDVTDEYHLSNEVREKAVQINNLSSPQNSTISLFKQELQRRHVQVQIPAVLKSTDSQDASKNHRNTISATTDTSIDFPDKYHLSNEIREKAVQINNLSSLLNPSIGADKHILLYKQEELQRRRVQAQITADLDSQEVSQKHRLSVCHNAIRKINGKIQNLEQNLRDKSTQDQIIRNVQNYLLQIHSIKKANNIFETHASDNCQLIIGVDSTPANQAGYCVNLVTKTISWYVVNWRDLPWQLHDQKHPAEFEMKNFIFALTLWERDILKWNRIRIYTDNGAISKSEYDRGSYGKRAYKVLNHYIYCKGVHVLNLEDLWVNKFKNLATFAQFLRPADDLSRLNVVDATNFLSKLYEVDLENISGTHCLDKTRLKVWYIPNDRYHQVISYAKSTIARSNCDNPVCKRSNLLNASLRINR